MNKLILLLSSVLILSGCSDSPKDSAPSFDESKVSKSSDQGQNTSPSDKIVEGDDPADPQIDIEEGKKGQESSSDTNLTPVVKQNGAEKMVDWGFTVHPDDVVLGNREAKVVMIEYFSMTCPHCVVYHNKIFPQLKKDYIETGKIAYVVRDFITSKQDLNAVVLAHCNGDQENYFKFLDVLFAQQSNWAVNKNYQTILQNIASVGGVNEEQYTKCLNDENKINILMSKMAFISKNKKFFGTPAFFINGVHYDKAYSVEELSKAIENAIKDAAKNQQD